MNLQKGKHTPGNHNNHQPRGPYSNTRIQSTIPAGAHLQRLEDYTRQGSGYQQPVVQGLRHYTNLGSVPSGTGSPHDMNKQATLQPQAQNTAGLYAPPSAGVAGPGNQGQQPSAMPGAAPVSSSPHPGSAGPRSQQVVQQHPNSRPQMFYQQPGNVIRAVHRQTAHWQAPQMSHTQQPQQQQYGNSMQQSWFPQTNHIQFANMQMLRSAAPVNPMMNYSAQVNPQFSPNAQYQQLPTGQQQIMYHPHAQASFYNTLPQMYQLNNQVYNNPSRTSIQSVPQARPATPPPKEKNIITIQDPETLQDMTDTILYPHKANPNQTEPSTHQPSDIAIEFAAKVASVATPVSSRQDSGQSKQLQQQQQQTPLSMAPPVMIQQVMESPIPTNESMLEQDELDGYNRRGITPDNVVPVYELGHPIDMTTDCLVANEIPTSSQSMDINQFSDVNRMISGHVGVQMETISTSTIPPLISSMESLPLEVVPPTIIPLVKNSVVPDNFSSPPDLVPVTNVYVMPPSALTGAIGSLASDPMQPENQTIIPQPEMVLNPLPPFIVPSMPVVPIVSTTVVNVDYSDALSDARRTSIDSGVTYDNVHASSDRVPIRELSVERKTFETPLPLETTTTTTPPPTPAAENIEDKENVVLKLQQNGDVREGFATMQESKESLEARDSKKVSRARKMKELNRKGDSKEGSEMDAFVDKGLADIEVSPSLASKIPSPTPVISSPTVDGELEFDQDEVRKVAEKNEENKRFSQEVAVVGEPTPVIEPPETETPKYQYKEDQWSPLNPEGKKHYDRAFLIMLQSQPMSLQKPKGLPDLDVIKNSALQLNLPEHRSKIQPQVIHHNQHDMFMPMFARGGNTPRHTQGGVNRRQSQQGRDKPKKIISISSSLNEDVKLHASTNAWKPGRKLTQEEMDAEEAKTEDLYKRVRGILNKLTPQKFTTLVEQVKDLPIDTEARLTGIIDLVFEKAVDEPNFSVPYANMCKNLMKKAVPSEIEGTNVNFRKLLLTKCQREFERDRNDALREEKMKEMAVAESEEKKKVIKEEIDDEERKARRRSLGNIRFIGELFKLQMLTATIMHDCLQKLLKERDEESLECLCRLLTTIGKELDDKPKEKGERASSHKHMDGYFDKMRKVVDIKSTTSRVRFMLQDVMDLRKRNWVPRREENNPKTIDEIHIEAEREAQNQQQLLAAQPMQQMNKRMDDRDGRRKRNDRPGGNQDDGWSTVGGGTFKNRGSFNTPCFDNKPPKISSKPFDETVQLGPTIRSFTTSWSRGSSGGSASKTLNQEIESKPSNRFQLLQSEQETKKQPRHELTTSPAFNKSSSSARREPSSGRAGSQGPPANTQLRKTASQMSVRERDNALAAVKAFADQQSALDTKGVDSKKKETISPAVTPANSELVMTGSQLTEEEMQIKVSPLVDEFLHNFDFDEAIRCILELTSSSTAPMFFSTAINHALERSSQSHAVLGQLFHKLVNQGFISITCYIQGLQTILDLADELEIDIPKIWTCLAEIVAPMVQDGSTSMGFLKEALSPFIQNRVAAKFMPALLHQLSGHSGPRKVYELWHNAGLQWSYFLSQDQNEEEFIVSKKLEFTQHEVKPASTTLITVEEMKTQLDFFLNGKRSSGNEDIFDWIEANMGDEQIRMPRFIRALVTAVMDSATKQGDGQCQVDVKIIKERISLLQKYLENKEHLELQALYAIQALVHRLQHPKGMLASIFEVLYDEDAISEDAFTQWEKSADPAEQEGKGVALKSATSFFTWLNEAEEDSGAD